jgi:TrpR family trp operon transcriptional repressor
MPEIDEIAKVFCRIDDIQVMKEFFDEIFTPAERRDFALRWELMKLIRQGMPQRQIASKLRISLCKITRGAKIVKNQDSVTNQIMNDKIGETHGTKDIVE